MGSRRKFIKSGLYSGAATALLTTNDLYALFSCELSSSGVSCQYYPWYTFFKREGREWSSDLAHSMEEFSKAGFNSFEPSFSNVDEVQPLYSLLKQYGISMPSFYVNSELHEGDKATESIKQVLDIARVAASLGTKIVVTNPSPISWGGAEDKTDEQLINQANALDELGDKLRTMGLSLAYHTHDAEMRNGAREFHHMLLNTDPNNVKLCLDAHWIFRGCGDSQVALFDIVDLYIHRVAELHLRQSRNGIWTEDFTDGDIDYRRLAEKLRTNKVKPLIVLEQAVEEGSPHTMDAVEAHRSGHNYTKEIFGGLI
jgi:inosose dehydratase